MGHENHHHHHHFHHYQLYHHKSTFLPMLCSRPYIIKEVTLPSCKKNRSGSSSNDPLSPRIGCMGQVKRKNKVASGIPGSQHRLSFTSSRTSATNSPVSTYSSKLKKLFSGKNLTTATTPTTTAATTVQRLVQKKEKVVNCSIRIEEMDPPLPVRKRETKLEEGKQMDSLWERRRRTGLESLQLQQIHHSKICLNPTTV